MIMKDCLLLVVPPQRFIGLVMDDGCEAVVDTFLYFENERWASCDVTFALEESHWKIDHLALR